MILSHGYLGAVHAVEDEVPKKHKPHLPSSLKLMLAYLIDQVDIITS